jgi:hypothetical protein
MRAIRDHSKKYFRGEIRSRTSAEKQGAILAARGEGAGASQSGRAALHPILAAILRKIEHEDARVAAGGPLKHLRMTERMHRIAIAGLRALCSSRRARYNTRLSLGPGGIIKRLDALDALDAVA